MSTKEKESISDNLYDTKEKTHGVDYELPGYITSTPEYDTDGNIVLRGVLPDGQTKWEHKFEEPRDWSEQWELVRFIESDEFKWDASTFDGEFIVDEPVPLRKVGTLYKIDIPESEPAEMERRKQKLLSVLSKIASINWANIFLVVVWSAVIVSMLLMVMVVVVL